MREPRFKEQGENSWYGRMVYDRVIPRDHFLRALLDTVPWERFTYKLVKWYKGKAKEGRPPYDPSVILRMFLLSYLYSLSERATEQAVNDTLSMKFFLGLAVDEPAPDHSTLTAFRDRIIANGRQEKLDELLSDIVQIAKEKGIQFGKIQVLDSVHTSADVNVQKDDQRRRKEGKPPRDGDARWGVKGTRKARTDKGERVTIRETFYGYKAHVSLNSATHLITSVAVTGGNAYDGHLLPVLVKSDLAQALPVGIVSADRGYDDSDNHILLWDKGIHSGIRLNDLSDPEEGWARGGVAIAVGGARIRPRRCSAVPGREEVWRGERGPRAEEVPVCGDHKVPVPGGVHGGCTERETDREAHDEGAVQGAGFGGYVNQG